MTVAPGLRAQNAPAPADSQGTQDSANTDKPNTWFKIVSFGFHVRFVTGGMFEDGTKAPNVVNSTANITQTFSSTFTDGKAALGPVLEVRLPWHFTLVGETFFEHVRYNAVTTTYKGQNDLSSSALKSTVTERTKALYWDIPILLRYRGTSRNRILSKGFVEAGVTLRKAKNVKTGTETAFADSTTAYNEIPITPAAAYTRGTVIGAGFRFVDDFNIKATPEVRYTMWNKSIFDSNSTRSQNSQLEVGLSIVF
jgi:hypothetical protein